MIEWLLVIMLYNGKVLHIERLSSEPECDRIGSITLSAMNYNGSHMFRCEPVKALK